MSDGKVSRPHCRRVYQVGELLGPTLENAVCHNMEIYMIECIEMHRTDINHTYF